jgi:hypothetical protein
VRDPPRSPRDIPLSTKVGTKFRRQVAVDQLVYFARGIKATEFFFVLLFNVILLFTSEILYIKLPLFSVVMRSSDGLDDRGLIIGMENKFVNNHV